MSATSLPRVIRWLITIMAPTDNRDFLLDDLDEEYMGRRATCGTIRALAWLLSQTARSLGPLAMTRMIVSRKKNRSDAVPGASTRNSTVPALR